MEESHLTNEIVPNHFISNINPTPLALFIMCTPLYLPQGTYHHVTNYLLIYLLLALCLPLK